MHDNCIYIQFYCFNSVNTKTQKTHSGMEKKNERKKRANKILNLYKSMLSHFQQYKYSNGKMAMITSHC